MNNVKLLLFCYGSVVNLCVFPSASEPKTLAAIFLKRKPAVSKPDAAEENQTTAVSSTSSSSAVLPVNTSACTAKKPEPPQVKEKSDAEKDAANRAFKALFTGASSQKSLTAASAIIEACPAPWPTVSHVCQKEDDGSSDGSFWCLPWPAVKSSKWDVSSHSLFPHGK